jgi:hypothetical protein
MSNPESFSNFYQNEKLGFDIKLVERGFSTFKPFFKKLTLPIFSKKLVFFDPFIKVSFLLVFC